MDDGAAVCLQTRIADLCGHLNVLHAQLVDSIVEALEGDLWMQWGLRSPEHWLSWQAGLSPSHARQLVDAARRKAELPVTFAAFADGELSVDQVAAVVKHVPAHNDAEVCALAKSATVTQLRHVLSTYVYDTAAEPDPVAVPVAAEGSGDPRDCVSMSFNDPGRFSMYVNAPSHHGELIETAVNEARDALFQAGNTNVTWVEALVEVCNRSMGAVTSASRRDRFRVYWHLDTDAGGGPVDAWFNGGAALPPSLRDALLCDGVVRPLWMTDGKPINVGRTIYIVPPHTRRMVLDRDRTCRCPGCNATTHLEVHHIEPFPAGPTETYNLAALCPHDHDAHHRGEFTMHGNADIPGDLKFYDRHGRLIPEAGIPNPPTGPPPGPPPGKCYKHPTGERFDSRWLQLSDRPIPVAHSPT